MSDTPLDHSLDVKTSTRMPAFLDDRIETFREDYNQLIDEAAGNDEESERFRLESRSEAIRRLIDIGITHFSTQGLPDGFQFDPLVYLDDTEDEASVECPDCYEDDPALLRAKGPDFTTVVCLNCGKQNHVDDVTRTPIF